MMPADVVEMIQPYEERSFDLQSGDLVALFSDGVTEAHDEEENEYGEARIADFLRPIANETADVIVSKVFEELDRYAGSAPQYDDITLFILKRVN
jgi:sigma-B regulation protein RsbU (phosphoserine phosphatase)